MAALDKRVRLVKSDLFSALGGRSYDLIVSNPPYVKAASMKKLPEEFRREPRLALASGSDGLDHTRTILAQAKRHLEPGAASRSRSATIARPSSALIQSCHSSGRG